MPTVSRTFDVDPSPEVVVRYLADFGNAEQWDPGTERCLREGEGPVEVGASWHNTSKIAGISTELTYTLEQLSDQQIVFVGRNDTATSTETIDVATNGTGSTIPTPTTSSSAAPPSSRHRSARWSSRRSATTLRSSWSRSWTPSATETTGDCEPGRRPFR